MNQVPQVQPAPLESLVSVGTARGADGTSWVLLAISTPNGTAYHFLTPEAVEKVALDLTRNAATARSGIEVATIVPGNGNGKEAR